MLKLTRAQLTALNKLYKRNPDGAKSWREFRARAMLGGTLGDYYIYIGWLGMFVGIEKDGYTHT